MEEQQIAHGGVVVLFLLNCYGKPKSKKSLRRQNFGYGNVFF
jgi:hypothetical protein